MMSRCPTMTFSTSARNRSKAATNSWTRASCVIVLSFHGPRTEYYRKQGLDHSLPARNVADFQGGSLGQAPRRSFLKHRTPSRPFSRHHHHGGAGDQQVNGESAAAAGAHDDRVDVERGQRIA